MGDIDILVEQKDWLNSVDLLINEGYQNHYLIDRSETGNFKHFPGLFKKGEPAIVEVHQNLLQKKYEKKFSSDFLMNHFNISEGKNKLPVPDKNFLFLHCILHSMLDHKAYISAHIRLREIFDIYSISKDVNTSELLEEYPFFHKQILAIIHLTGKLTGIRLSDNKISFSSRLFLFRHSINLKFRFFLVLTLFFYVSTEENFYTLH